MINYLAVLAAAVVQFVIGAVWYSALFGKVWWKIHNVAQYSEEERKRRMQGVGVLFAIQFVITVVTTIVLDAFINALSPLWSAYAVAGLIWIGFVVPVQLGAIMFGETEKHWMIQKVLIMAGCMLVCLMAAAAILRYF